MDPQRPSFMITGTGVPGKRAAQLAYGGFWLSVGSDAIRIPRGGIGPLSSTFPQVADELRRRIDAAGCPALVAGHSQGGFDALMFAVKYPAYCHTAMAISTPLGGLEYSIAGMRRDLRRRVVSAARPLAGMVNPIWHGLEPAVRWAIKSGAPSLHSLAWLGEEVLELRQLIAEGWDPAVRMALVGSLDDRLVRVNPTDPANSTAFAMQLPVGEPDRYCLFTGEEPPMNDELHFIKADRGGHLSMVASSALYRLVMRYSYPPEVPVEALPDPIPTPAA